MDRQRTDDAAPEPAYDLFGRVGSWHSYRLLFFVGGLFFFLLVPWDQVPDARAETVVRLNLAVGVAWALPCWCAGVTAGRRSVRFNYGLFVRRFRWDDIVLAKVAWHGVDPRLRLDLVDGREVWAPGFVVPMSQQSSQQDGWRSTEMFRAARLITAEAERRRRPPPEDGTLQPVAAPRGVRPARALGTAA